MKKDGEGEAPQTSNQQNQLKLRLSSIMLQYCFFPRLLHSAKDALFSFQFLKLLHKLRVPNFYILDIIINVLKCILPVIHCASEEEADNLGIFFLEFFKQLNHWSNKDVWAKECQTYEGFAKTISSNECISHSDFLNIV